MKIIIVIPTYNERENVGPLVETLSKEIEQIEEHEVEVLIVDDSSPDRTAELVTELSVSYPFLHLHLRKEKKGLGAAYIDGFREAIKLGADVIVEMDADFQHDPRDVKRLIEEIDNGYDYVIGSRFVKGGSIPKQWAFYRKLLSYGGSLFTKVVLGIYSINDFTSGFKASRVKGFVDRIDLDSILSDGFAYKIDLLHKMHRIGAKTKEVPIVFGLRDRGDSKLETEAFLDSLFLVLRIRTQKSKSFIKFVMVGFTGFGVDSILANLLRLTVLPSDVSSALSGFIAMMTTFTLNTFWSFGDVRGLGIPKRARGLVIYVISSYIPIIFRSWFIGVCTGRFGDTFVVFNLAFLVGISFGLVWNFTVYSKIIWKKSDLKSV